MVVCGPVHVIPRDLLGRPSQETGIALSVLPVPVRDAIITTIMRVAVGDLSRWGIVRPSISPQKMIEEQGRVPILDVGTIAKIKEGKFASFRQFRKCFPPAWASPMVSACHLT